MLFSEGEVEIVMGVPADSQPAGRRMTIKTSGVHLETKTGKATTDRPTSFSFDQGEGKAVGAMYDPHAHELHIKRGKFTGTGFSILGRISAHS